MPGTDAEEGVKVLTTWPSMFGMRIVIALKEKGVEFQYQEELLSNKSQLLLQSNPVHKKIPVLIHNGRAICESLLILHYIDEAWASKAPSFLPPKDDPHRRALARFWAEYIDNKFNGACYRILKSPEGELQEQAKKDVLEALTTLEGALRDVFEGGRPYFGGEALGLVDIALAPFIAWFKAYETIGNFKMLDDKNCPHLSAWVSKVSEHPSVKAVLTSQAPPDKVVEFSRGYRKRLLAA